MTNDNDVRRAHYLLDDISIGHQPNVDDLNHLRSFLPELPKQKALAEIIAHVYDVWVGTDGNEWPDDVHGELETWLDELQRQLRGLNTEPAAPAHPEFLETEADYENAPEGTIVASAKTSPVMKYGEVWESAPYMDRYAKTMAGESRRVLRWGK